MKEAWILEVILAINLNHKENYYNSWSTGYKNA